MRANSAWGACVYHAGIKYDERIGEIRGVLTWHLAVRQQCLLPIRRGGAPSCEAQVGLRKRKTFERNAGPPPESGKMRIANSQ